MMPWSKASRCQFTGFVIRLVRHLSFKMGHGDPRSASAPRTSGRFQLDEALTTTPRGVVVIFVIAGVRARDFVLCDQ
jgi:hypothetical protein